MKIIILALLLILSVPIYSQDTIRVMMTYSDTTLTELVGVDDEGEEYSVIGYDEYVYWRRGYVVKNTNIKILELMTDLQGQYGKMFTS